MKLRKTKISWIKKYGVTILLISAFALCTIFVTSWEHETSCQTQEHEIHNETVNHGIIPGILNGIIITEASF